MSEENIEIIRKAFELVPDESFFDVLDHEIEFDMSDSPVPEGARVYHGHDGVREFFRHWLGTWKDYRFEVEELIDAGDDRVLAVVHEWGRGKGSGAAVEGRHSELFTLSNGKIVHWKSYPDHAEALKAAGLHRGSGV
jgi:ketosteroid isomerase-like protein